MYYLFILSIFKPDLKFKPGTLLHFIPFILALIILLFRHYQVFQEHSGQAFSWLYTHYDSLLDILLNGTL
ncbi:MAG: hypothetical protein JW801_13485 [Bacteroidales bacterium]|nr:hypothetical protein [Bacteroidales bacterium]